ncbi:hypothetical protein JEQ12_015891 [Ovis aries]|uniref:Uncharacterized protein n=1 Tax=Ovis aries TaxID=9940 RepID=A0A836D2Q3_SHEEP|nr:hypothetical protein JEQ12_015891 [Ovis aries]
MAMIEGLEWQHQGAFLTNELFFDAQMLRQIGGGAHGESQRRYLEKLFAMVCHSFVLIPLVIHFHFPSI